MSAATHRIMFGILVRGFTLAGIGAVGTSVASAQARLPIYNLRVRVQPDSSRLDVTGTVLLPPADTARDQVTLVLHAVFQNPQFEFVDPVAGGARELAVTRADSEGYAHWTLRLPHRVAAHTAVKLRFTYGGDVSAAHSFHVGPDGSYVEVGWLPVDPVVTEKDSRATGTLSVAVPPGFTVVGTGETRSGAAARARGQFTFETTVPRRLAFTVGKYVAAHHKGATPITVYFLRTRPGMEAFADSCARALSVLVRAFGSFPYHELAIVEVPTGPAQRTGFGGRSVNGILLVSSANLDPGFNLAFVAHEMSHEWWADMIETRGSPGETNMLGEALAGYGSLRAVEALEGQAAAKVYRSVGYPGYRDTRLSWYYDLAGAGLDTVPLAGLRDPMAHTLANIKGFRVWSALAAEIGPDRFRQGLREFAHRHSFTPVTWTMFTAAMDAAAGRRLDWFFEQWVTRGTGMPQWSVAWRQAGDSVLGTVAQGGHVFRATVDVRLWDETHRDSMTRSVVLRDKITTFAFRAPFPVHSIAVDPDDDVLHWTAEALADARAYGPVKRAYMLDELGYTAEALMAFNAALDSVPNPDVHGLRYLAEYGLGWMHLNAGRWKDAATHMEVALQPSIVAAAHGQACREPGGNCSVPWGYYVVAKSAQQLGDSVLLCKAVTGGIAADSASRWGAATQIRAIGPKCVP
jgi:hypothetical protein